MRKGKRGQRWAVGLAVTGLAVALAVAFYPRERLLLERATRVADVSQWWKKRMS